MYFLREQLFWSLWLLISVAAALYFHGCWLISVVAYLLKSLILKNWTWKKYFFNQSLDHK